MLFDLRSRGRRTTVRVIYLFLALVMVAGLVLVGVGTGTNQGGLLNAFTNNGSGSGQSSADHSSRSHKAYKTRRSIRTRLRRGQSLAQARWAAAGTGQQLRHAPPAPTPRRQAAAGLAATAWDALP